MTDQEQKELDRDFYEVEGQRALDTLRRCELSILRDRFNTGQGSPRERHQMIERIRELNQLLGIERPTVADPFEGLTE